MGGGGGVHKAEGQASRRHTFSFRDVSERQRRSTIGPSPTEGALEKAERGHAPAGTGQTVQPVPHQPPPPPAAERGRGWGYGGVGLRRNEAGQAMGGHYSMGGCPAPAWA